MTRRALAAGIVAGSAMALLYATVLTWAGGLEHLRYQAGADWWLVGALVATFGAQVAVLVELRARHARHHLAGAGGAASGTSAVGMVACCAHHLVELAPLAGAAGVATTLGDARIPLMLGALALNVAVLIAGGRRLRRVRSTATPEMACAA